MNIDNLKERDSWKRGIAIDMDGVIVDGMKYHVKAWLHTFDFFFNEKIDPIEIYLLEGVKGEKIIEKITEDLGIIITNEKKSEIHSFKRNFFNNIFKIEPIPGITNFLIALLERRYILALVTGTSREIADKVISELSFQDYFDVIISADDTKYGKPNPEPYLTASKRLGVTIPNCLVIENAPAGISSAISAGMKCLAIETYLNEKFLNQADLVFPNLFEAQKWIVEEFKKSNGKGAWHTIKNFYMQ